MALPLAGHRLDLDHIGAEIAEALRRERPGHGDRTVQHAIAAQNSHFDLS